MAAPALPYWWVSSLIRTQLPDASSERNTPAVPPTVPIRYSAGYVCPAAALPNPMLIELSTVDTLVKLAPEVVECHRPPLPASQMSPSCPATALKYTPLDGSPVAPVAVNVWPPLVLTWNV